MTAIRHTDYLRVLEPWVRSARKDLHSPPDRPDLACYGTGYNSWGVQTNQKALAAFAVLAADPELDEDRAGTPREAIRDDALRLLRFCLESHVEGAYHCTDGESWGHTWISVLGTERMMHGVEAIEEHLTEEDRALLRKVFVSEAEWLLDEYPIVAGTVKNNKPESNLWNGAFLHRVALMYPDCPRAAAFREKGSRFLVNSISIASDAASEQIVDGRQVRDWFVGDNFFEGFGCNHHGYLNVGYMYICLSNAAMFHFSCKNQGWEAPQALYHHVADLWRLVKRFVFPDGRLLRIGGDTRVRYCYCQDYVIPAWIMMADLGDPDCARLEQGWLETVRQEVQANGDGGFLTTRCADLRRGSPQYFTRLEADRAVTVSMGAYWRRAVPPPGQRDATPAVDAGGRQPAEPVFQWSDEYHGACFVRGRNRLVSWVWRAAELPNGLCLPPADSSLAEWRQNLAGEVTGMGLTNGCEVRNHGYSTFEAGFLTWGEVAVMTSDMVSEGEKGGQLARQWIVFAALPDDRTAMIMQFCKTTLRAFVRSRKGLSLLVPNDIFNGCLRTYFAESGAHELPGAGWRHESILDLRSEWVNIEDKLGVVKAYGSEELVVNRPGRRQIGLAASKRTKVGGMLYADQICLGCDLEVADYPEGATILDLGCVLLSGADREATADCCRTLKQQRSLISSSEDVRQVWSEDACGVPHLLCANFGTETGRCVLLAPEALRLRELGGGESRDAAKGAELALELQPGEARLWRLEAPALARQ